MAWKLYNDAACTDEFDGTLDSLHLTDGSEGPQDFVLWFAEVDEDPGDNQIIMKQEINAPGTNPIIIALVDANPGSGQETDTITLATSAAGLDTATAGASLDLGTTLLSGVSEAVEIHIRLTNTEDTVSVSTELTAQIVETLDSPVTPA